MNLTLDIEGRANEIRQELLHSYSKVGSLLLGYKVFGLDWWLSRRRVKTISKKVFQITDEFILTLEGFHGHISELTLEEATRFLSKVRSSLKLFEELDEQLVETIYPSNPILKQRLRYLLKTTYKTEALLHVATTKHLPVEPTPDYIQAGLSRISKEAILKAI